MTSGHTAAAAEMDGVAPAGVEAEPDGRTAGAPAGGALHVRPLLGFLGVGWIGRHRMEAIRASGVADVGMVADPSIEAAAAAAEAAGGARVAGSLDELLDAGLDGIVIATPSALHAEESVRALERGVPVFCQKPLGRNAREARWVVDAARTGDLLLGVDLSYRHTAAMRRIREVVAAGEIGDVYAVDLVFHNAYGPDKPWFRDPRLSGGGCVMDLGIHLVDLALWMLDFPALRSATSRLFAGGGPVPPDGVEDYAVARLDLENGATAQLACSWYLPAGRDAVISASFYGTRGAVEMRNVDGSFYDFVADRMEGTARTRLVEPPDEWGGRAAVDWAASLAAGARFDPRAERLVDVSAALDAIYAADR